MEKKQEQRLSTVGSQFRQRAGLPERKNDKPADLSDTPELGRTYVPEGGYGGDPDSATSQKAEAVTADEGDSASPNNTTANNADMASDADGRNLTPDDKPAKKTAAKKTAAKKTAAKKTKAKAGAQ